MKLSDLNQFLASNMTASAFSDSIANELDSYQLVNSLILVPRKSENGERNAPGS